MGISIAGNDTIIINSRTIVGHGNEAHATLDYPNSLIEIATGKNENVMINTNFEGRQATLILRLMRGSGDDIFLNSLLNLQNKNIASFTLLTGEVIKNIGDGDGGINHDTYTLSAGVFSQNVNATSTGSGDVEDAVCVYTMMFGVVTRNIV